MKKGANSKNKFVTENYLDKRLQFFKQELEEEIGDQIQGSTIKVLQAVDRVVTRFDALEKDTAAHSILHKRITDDLHNHDLRIKKLEAGV